MFKTEPNPMTKELVSHDNQVVRQETPLPVTNGLISLFIGKKGTGKTTVIVSLLKSKKSPYYNTFDRIYLFSPTAQKDSKLDFLVDEVSSYGNFYNELTNENLQEVLDKITTFNQEFIDEQMSSDEEVEHNPVFPKGMPRPMVEGFGDIIKKKKKSKKPKVIVQPHSLIILDDTIHSINSQRSNPLNQLATQSRHFKTDVWITSQKYNKLPLLIRTQADTLTLFKTDNAKEFKAISDDWAINPELLKKMFDFATNEPNSFLHISFFSGKPVFYKKYDKILI